MGTQELSTIHDKQHVVPLLGTHKILEDNMQQTVNCGTVLGYACRTIDVIRRLLLSVTIVALAGCSATADRAARLQTSSKGMSVAQVT